MWKLDMSFLHWLNDGLLASLKMIVAIILSGESSIFLKGNCLKM